MYSLSVWAFTALAAVQVALGAPAGLHVSKTSRCGASFGLTCQGSPFGNCCSQYGYCGLTSDYCGKGCQPGYGACNSGHPSTPPATPKVSKDGTCGGEKDYTCLGSGFGDCCSQYGWCGRSKRYCSTGCNPLFGICHAASSSSPALPSSSLVVSSNARCGNAYGASPGGMTCRGSSFGNCCSRYSYCGSTEDYCGAECQPEFGDCGAVSEAPSSTLPLSSTSESSSTSSSVLTTSCTSSSLLTTSSLLESSPSPIETSTSLDTSTEPNTSTIVASTTDSSTVISATVPPTSTDVQATTTAIVTSSTDAPSSASLPSTDAFSSSIQTSTDTVISTPEPSTTVSSTLASTPSSIPPPAPTNVVADGGFESTGTEPVPWIIRTSAPGQLIYNFRASNTAPYSGSQVASVTYSAGAAAYQAWFYQPLTLQTNTLYNFSGRVKASTANPGCSVTFYIGTADGTRSLKTLGSITSANINVAWREATGFYQTDATTVNVTINVRWVCTSSASRSYFVDDIVFQAA